MFIRLVLNRQIVGFYQSIQQTCSDPDFQEPAELLQHSLWVVLHHEDFCS